MRRLAYTCFLERTAADGSFEERAFLAGEEVPDDWAALITNPAAWADTETADPARWGLPAPVIDGPEDGQYVDPGAQGDGSWVRTDKGSAGSPDPAGTSDGDQGAPESVTGTPASGSGQPADDAPAALWRDYARGRGVEVPANANRDVVQHRLREAGKLA